MEGWHILFILIVLISVGHLAQWAFLLWIEDRVKDIERTLGYRK